MQSVWGLNMTLSAVKETDEEDAGKCLFADVGKSAIGMIATITVIATVTAIDSFAVVEKSTTNQNTGPALTGLFFYLRRESLSLPGRSALT